MRPPSQPPHTKIWVAVLLLTVGALALRIAYHHVDGSVDHYEIAEDGLLVQGDRVGDGREYEGRGWGLVSPASFWVTADGDGNAPPGYPFLIGAVYALTGRSPAAILWLNILLSTLTVPVTFLLGRALAGPVIGLGAGAIMTIDPFSLYYTTFLTTETPAILITTLCLLAFVRFDKPGPGLAVLQGSMLALCVLTRNNLIAVVGVALAWQAMRTLRGRVRPSSLALTLLVALVLPGVTYAQQRSQLPVEIDESPSQLREVLRQMFWPEREYRKLLHYEYTRAHGREPTRQQAAEHDAAARRALEREGPVKILALITSHRMMRFFQLLPAKNWSPVPKLMYFAGSLVPFLLGTLALAAMLPGLPPGAAGDRWRLAALVLFSLIVLHAFSMAYVRHRVVLHPMLSAALLQTGWLAFQTWRRPRPTGTADR